MTLSLWMWKTILTKSHLETLIHKGVFIGLPIGLSDLSPLRLGSLNLA